MKKRNKEFYNDLSSKIRLEEARSNYESTVKRYNLIVECHNRNTMHSSINTGGLGAYITALVIREGLSAFTYVLVGTFGVASTCTVIATLSDTAASNATLTVLGGGALTIDVGGMAVCYRTIRCYYEKLIYPKKIKVALYHLYFFNNHSSLKLHSPFLNKV